MNKTPDFVFPAEVGEARALGQARVVRGVAQALPFDEGRLAQLLAEHCDEHCDEIRGGIGRAVGRAADEAREAVTLERLTAMKSSLRVRRVHVIDAWVRTLAFAAHAFFDEEININAYWSPAGVEMGLAPHADGYDIVVLQAAGAKRWMLTQADGSVETFTLETGDALFLPKALRHRADTPHARSSLHLTVGIYAKTHQSIAEWISAELAGSPWPEPMPAAAQAIASVKNAVDQLLAPKTAGERFLAYRRAAEYERMLMTPREHARSDARRFR